MGPNLFLPLLLGLAGQGSAGSFPEVLQAQVGGSIRVQCLYRLQDIRARKVWCRFMPDGCQPLVSSAVDRRAPGHSRAFLTDLGSGLLQVEMIALREDDAGEYGCVVEGPTGPQTLHRIALDILPAAPGLKEEDETYNIGSLADSSSSDPAGSASPLEPSKDDKRAALLCHCSGIPGKQLPTGFRAKLFCPFVSLSIPLIWGTVVLLGLLVAAVVLFAVMAKRKANRRGVCGRSQSSGISHMVPSSALHTTSDSGPAADVPLGVPYVRLDSPPSFDNTTYSSLPEPPSGKTPPPAPSSLPPLPSKVLISSNPVTYATVIFPGGDKGGRASREPALDAANSQTLPLPS
ncbi:trem-like transcript 1 protein isoform X1 [Rhinolophus ferrumequinum]|uniref:trem-like transcript 1 protein isoform X1 n=1 Tax=Rhinolophus ferrumequinum TaxID=59479 RepID=UPI00140F6778|nr:trem-like transcript 1 protein isoform X1 [Rhinolophus ferrumequinum]XP_032958416.1 trem-like transcript 1 protein isoform X1 [Rhinolophus ferrumequinum]